MFVTSKSKQIVELLQISLKIALRHSKCMVHCLCYISITLKLYLSFLSRRNDDWEKLFHMLSDLCPFFCANLMCILNINRIFALPFLPFLCFWPLQMQLLWLESRETLVFPIENLVWKSQKTHNNTDNSKKLI